MDILGNEFLYGDCKGCFPSKPLKSIEENSPETQLMSWLSSDKKENASSPLRHKETLRSPKYSMMSFETESSELFSEKFSFFSKKSRAPLNFHYFMKPSTILVNSPLVRKKHSNYENFDINETNEEIGTSRLIDNSKNTRKRALTYKRPSLVKEPIEEDFIRNYLYNEIEQANYLLNLMKSDLIFLLDFLQGKIDSCERHFVILKCLKTNTIPKEWSLQGFVLKEESLHEFLKVFLLKKEVLNIVIFQRKCEILPVIPLGKLFDPFNFVLSLAWQTAFQWKVFILFIKFSHILI